MHPVHLRPVENPKVSIVVPARNEARNLEVVLPTLPEGAEIIVVDGHSVDDTEAVVRRVRPDARFVQQTRRGKGNALAVGFAAATGDIIVMFDADGSADPAEIDRYVDALRAGADFAKGSRVLPGGGSKDITVLRDLGNKGLTGITNLIFRTGYTDLCYGYNAFWRDILPELDLPQPEPVSGDMQWGDGFEIETLLNCRVAVAKLKVTEVPSVELLRLFGESNLHAVKDGLRVLKTISTELVRARKVRRTAAPAAPVAPAAERTALRTRRRARRAVTPGVAPTIPAQRSAATVDLEEASA
ncbi:glycosyltransferase [Nakamurella sp. YIM 132087]|uniref:Glycosyltransferase n=1 Tax=Nakamurella alba TaxID=2665158 RepID=A0A7K1FHZ1_9ACTN|nr:glycosyltransferase family 2 protein [Nakamurella alba]MTD13747.1 glycosyltransferase [Nakamurella alba]